MRIIFLNLFSFFLIAVLAFSAYAYSGKDDTCQVKDGTMNFTCFYPVDNGNRGHEDCPKKSKTDNTSGKKVDNRKCPGGANCCDISAFGYGGVYGASTPSSFSAKCTNTNPPRIQVTWRSGKSMNVRAHVVGKTWQDCNASSDDHFCTDGQVKSGFEFEVQPGIEYKVWADNTGYPTLNFGILKCGNGSSSRRDNPTATPMQNQASREEQSSSKTGDNVVDCNSVKNDSVTNTIFRVAYDQSKQGVDWHTCSQTGADCRTQAPSAGDFLKNTCGI